MRISVKVKTKAKKESVEPAQSGLKVSVKEAPEKGKANERVIELLSKYFKTAKSNFEILSGHTSRYKIISLKK